MVLYTMNREYTEFAIRRLENQNISYTIQEVGTNKINLFFGKPECMEAIRHIITRPLNQLTPEEDFILGAMLGYDICQQCKRYCGKKEIKTNLQGRPMPGRCPRKSGDKPHSWVKNRELL